MLLPNRHVDSNKYRYGFNGHEVDNETKGEGNSYDFGGYGLDPRIGKRLQPDPVVKKHESPYATFANNPIWLTDPTGLDTLKITLNDKGKYKITERIKSKGDDVFNINAGEEFYSYTFKEGKKGEKRISALNLESNDEYTLGVYNISQIEGDSSYGFYVLPGGESSTKLESGKRLPDGEYYLTPSSSGSKWETPWVKSKSNSEVANRGIKWHPALSESAQGWTAGCFVVFPSYRLSNDCKIKVVPVRSLIQALNFVERLGGENNGDKKKGKYYRMRSTFSKQKISTLNLKSTWND